MIDRIVLPSIPQPDVDEVLIVDDDEVLTAAQSLALAFDGEVLDVGADWDGWRIFGQQSKLSHSEPGVPVDSVEDCAAKLDSSNSQPKPLALMLEPQCSSDQNSGAWISLNDLRHWYSHVSQNSQDFDRELLQQIASIGNLFKSQFGEDPFQECWFTDWSEVALQHWYLYAASKLNVQIN